MRNANLAKRGIDGNDIEAQVQDIENRGKVLLKQYKEQKGESLGERISAEESNDILEPLKGCFQLMENAINLSGMHFYYCMHIALSGGMGTQNPDFGYRYSALHFEKLSNMVQIWQKMKKILV